jgi:hypothetical protein
VLLRAAILLVVALTGCASEPKAGTTVILPADAERVEAEEDPNAPCKHVWEQFAWHTYEDRSTGVPVSQICVVTRCPKCGEIRHECQRRRR